MTCCKKKINLYDILKSVHTRFLFYLCIYKQADGVYNIQRYTIKMRSKNTQQQYILIRKDRRP